MSPPHQEEILHEVLCCKYHNGSGRALPSTADELSSDDLVECDCPTSRQRAALSTPSQAPPPDVLSFEYEHDWIGENDEMSNNKTKFSNSTLLGTAFITFITFASVQMVFAFVAGSQAMVGDSAAMMVDAMTYLLNYVAEIRKSVFDQRQIVSDGSSTPSRRQLERQRRKLVLQLELVPPAVSVATLIVVTMVVLHKAIKIFVLDLHRPRREQLLPNLNLMLTFSVMNLALDVLNMTCFANAQHLFGFATTTTTTTGHDHAHAAPSTTRQSSHAVVEYSQLALDGSSERSDDVEIVQPVMVAQEDAALDTTLRHTTVQISSTKEEENDGDEEHANLNMCSAYTHVFADTLRSLAVICAACVAKLSDVVTAEQADAMAAIVVSVLILLSLIPLLQGMRQSYAELRDIAAEQSCEPIMLLH